MRGEVSSQASRLAGHRKRIDKIEYQVSKLRHRQRTRNQLTEMNKVVDLPRSDAKCTGEDAGSAGFCPHLIARRVTAYRRLDGAIDSVRRPRSLGGPWRAVRVVHDAAWFSTRLMTGSRTNASGDERCVCFVSAALERPVEPRSGLA